MKFHLLVIQITFKMLIKLDLPYELPIGNGKFRTQMKQLATSSKYWFILVMAN